MSITTYHCLCTEVTLASTLSLQEIPKRQSDGSLICKVINPNENGGLEPGAAVLSNAIAVESTPIVLKLEDGFEKRYVVKCGRCGVTVGYQLDLGQFEESKEKLGRREDVVFVLPGGLMSTEEMEGKKDMEGEIEKVLGKAS